MPISALVISSVWVVMQDQHWVKIRGTLVEEIYAEDINYVFSYIETYNT